MRAIRNLVWIAVALLLSVAVASAQSLAEVAKKEKKRRESNQSESKTVITDRELTRGYGGLPATRQQAASTEGDAEGETSAAGDGGEGDTEDETKTPEYWRNRVAGTKEKIANLESALAKDDWGEGQRVGVDPRGVNNLGSRQQTEQQLQAARAELEAIRAEARRAGVPPGWTR